MLKSFMKVEIHVSFPLVNSIYLHYSSTFLFSSELASLLPHGDVRTYMANSSYLHIT